MKRRHVAGALLLAVAGGAFLPVRHGVARSVPTSFEKAPTFAELSDAKPDRSTPVLFIHHSCGGQLLAPEGPEAGTSCIYESHPSGGNLRAQLEREGYAVHEASYDSAVGNKTDLFDWGPKFSGQMDRILRIKRQDELLPDGQTNRVVVFKSCFPNNQFVGEGASPGDPRGPALTVWNARATLSALLPLFEQHPETLFVYVTAPPIAPRPEKQRVYRFLLDALRGRGEPGWTAQQATWARQLNDWVVSPRGWLAGYARSNVVVFDYYGVLTGNGQSNLLVYPTADDTDSHPSAEGNRAAAREFLPFLNRVVRRAGLLAPTASAGVP